MRLLPLRCSPLLAATPVLPSELLIQVPFLSPFQEIRRYLQVSNVLRELNNKNEERKAFVLIATSLTNQYIAVPQLLLMDAYSVDTDNVSQVEESSTTDQHMHVSLHALT